MKQATRSETPEHAGDFKEFKAKSAQLFAETAQLLPKGVELGDNSIRFTFSNLSGHSGEFQKELVKEMKTRSNVSAYSIPSATWAVFVLVAFIAVSSAFNLPKESQKSARTTGTRTQAQPRPISFAERVAFQRALEDVYCVTGFGQKRIRIPSLRSMR